MRLIFFALFAIFLVSGTVSYLMATSDNNSITAKTIYVDAPRDGLCTSANCTVEVDNVAKD
jgi:hypothetical protein